jgi:hypothetical protein
METPCHVSESNGIKRADLHSTGHRLKQNRQSFSLFGHVYVLAVGLPTYHFFLTHIDAFDNDIFESELPGSAQRFAYTQQHHSFECDDGDDA